MAETEFEVTYGGPALADGRMPVKDLAPSLLALGELFAEASTAAFPERPPAALNIKATDEGSFAVYLTLQSPEAWDQIVTLLSGKTITALMNLQNIVFGAGGLLWLLRELRGRRVVSKERLDSGLVRLTLTDGATLEVISEASKLHERRPARKNARNLVEPLYRDGVERVQFEWKENPDLIIERDDLPAFEPTDLDEDILDERTVDTFVTITTVSFVGGYKWRLSEGDFTFTADFEDEAFRERMRAGEEAFADGDRLHVRMRIVQKEIDGKLKVERAVVEVLDHEPRKQFPQDRIDFGQEE